MPFRSFTFRKYELPKWLGTFSIESDCQRYQRYNMLGESSSTCFTQITCPFGVFFLKSDHFSNTKTGFDEVKWSDLLYFQIWIIVSPLQKERTWNCLISPLQRIHRSSNLHFWVFKWEVVCGHIRCLRHDQSLQVNRVMHDEALSVLAGKAILDLWMYPSPEGWFFT